MQAYNKYMNPDKKEISRIAKLLSALVQKDQEMRKRWFESGFSTDVYNKTIDEENERELKKIVRENRGWLELSVFGKETVDNAWTLVQHAPNISFKKEILAEMKKLPNTEVEKKRVAQAEDRIRVNEGKPQLYGTSFIINLETGEMAPDPIEDPENVNARRASMGMDTFEEHLERAKKEYEAQKQKEKD